MIKPEQVPQSAWLAMRDLMHNGIRNEATLIAAALNAWPEAMFANFPEDDKVRVELILPITETPDGN